MKWLKFIMFDKVMYWSFPQMWPSQYALIKQLSMKISLIGFNKVLLATGFVKA